MNNDETLKAAIRQEAAAARQHLGDHPEADRLLAYVRGDLPAEGLEEVQEHLAVCASCARAVIDMAAFPNVEPVDPNRRLGDEELEEAWQRLAEELEAAPAGEVLTFRPRSRSPRWVYALAASLLVATVAFAVYVLQLRSTIEELRRPHADSFVADLLPLDAGQPRSLRESLAVPAWAARVVLLLNLGDLRTLPRYSVALFDQKGREIWSQDAVQRSPDGTFSLVVSRRLLPAGAYRVELRGEPGTLVTTYEFEIGYETPDATAGRPPGR